MKILLVNKYLYSVGGAENYMLNIGEKLIELGHEVQYFGIESTKNVVGNNVMEFAKCYENSKIKRFFPWQMIYSKGAYKKMKKVLIDFNPDIVHMNNINYQLTSSIIDACKDMNIPVVMTIHDPQLICPNHRLYIESKNEICTKCINGDFKNCYKERCMANSKIKSYIGYRESVYTHKNKKYDYISKFICPSEFIGNLLIRGGYSKEKILTLRNFCNLSRPSFVEKEDYILYYGRISIEKGISTLLSALPKNIKLIIAGTGPMVKDIPNSDNVEYVGFKHKNELTNLIAKAKFTVYPSEWYENSPLSIIESISLGTPVIGTNCGGIKELIQDGKNGLLFENKNILDLQNKILKLFFDKDLYDSILKNCGIQPEEFKIDFYIMRLLDIYKEIINAKTN